MASMMLRRTCGGLLALGLVGLALVSTSVGQHYWVSKPVGLGSVKYGLWVRCVTVPIIGESCSGRDINNDAAWLRAVQAFACLAAAVGVVGLATQMYLPVGATFQITSGVLGGITVGLFSRYSGESARDYHFAYYLMVAGSALLLINGITLAALAGREGCSMRKVMPPKASEINANKAHGRY